MSPVARLELLTQAGQPRGDAVDLLAGQLLAGADLLDDIRGRLGQEGVVAELPGGARQFLLRRGQILLQAAPLGGDVDGARRVDLDDDRASRQPHLDGADGLNDSSLSVSHASDRTAGICASRSAFTMSDSRAGTCCRSLRPWSLRNRRTSVISFCISATRCVATGSTAKPDGCGQSAMTMDSPPVKVFHSTSVTNGITGCSNLSSVSSTAASTAVVCCTPSAN